MKRVDHSFLVGLVLAGVKLGIAAREVGLSKGRASLVVRRAKREIEVRRWVAAQR